MLTRFEVQGFKMFKNALILDFKARDYSFNSSLVKAGIVKNALVYGPNGIGKSCLGFAIFDIVSHLTDNRPIRDSYLSEYQNISLSPTTPIRFRYDFEIDGDVIVYEYTKNAARELLTEKLNVNGVSMLEWDFFDADKCTVPLLRSTTLQVVLPDNKLSILKYIRRNIPTRTVPLLDKLMNFVDGMLWYRSLSEGNTYAGFTNGTAAIESAICKAEKLDEFSLFLRENDLDYKLLSKTIDNEERILVEDRSSHRKALFGNIASTGTKTLMLFFYWSFAAFNRLTFLFIDEFDAFFHFQTAASIMGRLRNSEFQVMLTSHNTYLMQNKFTRPDCCFLMLSGKIKSLPECTEREIREGHNLEKMYQNGVFAE